MKIAQSTELAIEHFFPLLLRRRQLLTGSPCIQGDAHAEGTRE